MSSLAYSCGQLKSTNWISQEPDFLAKIWRQIWNRTGKRSSKMVFSCYSHAFLAAPKFWAKFPVYIRSINGWTSGLRPRQLQQPTQQPKLLGSWWYHVHLIDFSVLIFGKNLPSHLIQWWVSPLDFHILEFFCWMEMNYLIFFSWKQTVLIEIYPKKTFSRFYWFFSACANIFGSIFWQIFTFGKSVLTIQKIFPIPAYSDGFRS